MLDLKKLRNQSDDVRAELQKRGDWAVKAFDDFLSIDAEWLKLDKELDPLRAQRNKAAGDIGRLKREKQDVTDILKQMETLKTQIKALEEKAKDLETQAREKALSIPNLPLPSVPVGKTAADNPVARTWGEPEPLSFTPKDHHEVGVGLGIVDFERAAKLSGARFSLLAGAGAKLERALIQFMLDVHTQEHGYTEIYPPFLVNSASMTGTGQLPKFAEESYACKEDDLFLIPTAEVPVTNLYRSETLKGADLPKAFCAYTACFRREAGSYGKDTRGLIRNHQFDKVELVRFCRPEESEAMLEKLTNHAETILQKLGLPYRVVTLCSGDMGFSAAKTYDLEVWMAGDRSGEKDTVGAWREISSCSTFTDYQARRMDIRFKADDAKGHLHTLNGSGVAVGRTLAAILENYQQEDGSVRVPDALKSYMNTDVITPQKLL